MNWIMLPVVIALLAVIYALNQKSKKYLLMKMVQSKILHQMEYSEVAIIQGYNLVYAFIVVPILLMAIALLTGDAYTYNLTFSIVVYISTFLFL
jgi:hypothetical protein